ncbi:universal stress protein [Streptomyces camponoticapitis]|uniref:Universal stress protein n=1 Tax=Streptomyces camponoticapitis TaxID=1616125 RepID=A0ABQ2ESZ4_9ACTN|nr:universal stress protein [Streptomyces camponoticapitis]GGK23279.1 universal stress protein [Streptomyces camponoticapitis]
MTDRATGDEILVGVDPRGFPALVIAWAVAEAGLRNSPLRLVVAVPPMLDTQHVDTTPQYMALRAQGERALTAAAESVTGLAPEAHVETELLDGFPAAVLNQRATSNTRMVVLGSRRLSRPAEILSASSVAVPVSAHADCPVAVVRATEQSGHDSSGLVVGVEGSASSRAAVAVAVEEADLRGVGVHAVWAWRRPAVAFGDDEAGVEKRRRLLAEAVAGPASAHPDVKISQEVRRGHPVEELARASASASAVVVGRRGRGGYSGMRLGSVAHGLLHRAECPVITVPAAEV